MSGLPYVTATGNIEKALIAIKSAATPDSVSQDFVKTILGIKGGSGNQIASYLKKIGLAASDGKPTDLYIQFRNSNKAISGAAIASALRIGYAPLYKRNEYMHRLSDDDLKGLVVEETGASSDSTVPTLIVSCVSALKSFAVFDAPVSPVQIISTDGDRAGRQSDSLTARKAAGNVGMNLSYTINLNLPATSDIAVFNAIFKSLRENLLGNDDD